MSRPAPRASWLAASALLAVTMSSGCGYSLAGRGSFLPEYIRNIARTHGINVNRDFAEVFEVYRVVS